MVPQVIHDRAGCLWWYTAQYSYRPVHKAKHICLILDLEDVGRKCPRCLECVSLCASAKLSGPPAVLYGDLCYGPPSDGSVTGRICRNTQTTTLRRNRPIYIRGSQNINVKAHFRANWGSLWDFNWKKKCCRSAHILVCSIRLIHSKCKFAKSEMIMTLGTEGLPFTAVCWTAPIILPITITVKWHFHFTFPKQRLFAQGLAIVENQAWC